MHTNFFLSTTGGRLHSTLINHLTDVKERHGAVVAKKSALQTVNGYRIDEQGLELNGKLSHLPIMKDLNLALYSGSRNYFV